MKKIINLFINTFICIIIFLFTLFVILIIFTYLFSPKNNMSIKNTISNIKTIGTEIIDFTFTDKNLANISLGDTTDTVNTVETSSNISNTTKYYYIQLDENAKIIYKTLEDNIDNLKKQNYTIDLSTTFNDLLHQSTGQSILNKSYQSALDAFFYDHPELFYVDLTKISLVITSNSIGPLVTYRVKLSPSDDKNYLTEAFSSEEEVIAAITKVESVKNKALSMITEKSDYHKILKVHNILVNSLEYNSKFDKENSRNIYGALINKKVVCEGYAKSFKYILDSLNIECILISGTATNSSNQTEPHMWNYVKLDGNWYGVDITWDDPIIIGGTSNKNIRYTYLLKGKNTFITTHTPNGKISDKGMLFSIPSLSSENY